MQNKQASMPVAAVMAWSHLWPKTGPAAGKLWDEQLRPGVSVLLDESGEEAVHWLSVLAGATPPAQGQVRCAGLCSQQDRATYQAQVYWHQPREPMAAMDMLAQQWLDAAAQRWPAWSDAAWQLHCEGFGLGPHLDKPLAHLSTGSLRKLGLAAALSSGARLTLLEEPIAALDSQSIRYLCHALDTLGDELAHQPQSPRWVIVAHWAPLDGVTWDEVLAPPPLVAARSAAV